MKEKNKLLSVKYEEILHDGEGKDAFCLKLPNGVEDWYSNNACKLDVNRKVLLIPKWMYVARQKEGRWEPKPIEAEIQENEQNVKTMENTVENTVEKTENNGNDTKITPEQIIKGIVPPSKRRKIKGKVIKIHTSTHRILFSQMQMFDFGFPKTMAFSFTDGHIFCIPDPNIEGLTHYDLKEYGGSGNFIIQSQGLVDDLMTFGRVGSDKKTFFLKSDIYSTTGNNLRIFTLKVVNK